MQVGYYALSLFAGALVAGAVAAIAWKRAVTPVGRLLARLINRDVYVRTITQLLSRPKKP